MMQSAVEVTKERFPGIKEKRLMEALRDNTISYFIVKEADLSKFATAELREVFARSLHNGKLTPEVLLDAASYEEPLKEDALSLCRLASWTKKELKTRGMNLSVDCIEQLVNLVSSPEPFPGNQSYKGEVSENPVKPVTHLGRTA